MNWAKWQTILLAIGLVGAAIAAYVNIESMLAVHTTKLDSINSNMERMDRTVNALATTLNGVLLNQKWQRANN